MIVHLDIPAEQLAVVDPELLATSLSELLRSHRRGYHLAVVSRECVAWIIDNVELSAPDRSLVARLGQEFTQTGSLIKSAAVFIKLVPGAAYVPANERSIAVSLRDFVETNLSDATQLLLEDADNDGRIYDVVFDLIRKKKRFANLNYRNVHGGGSGTVRLLKRIVEEKRSVVVILDSDRESPFHPMPAKVRTHETVIANANWSAGIVLCLPCREIENLIPLEALQHLPCVAQKNATLEWLRQKERDDEASKADIENRTVMFFDLKLGVVQAKLQGMTNLDGKNWWTARVGAASVEGLGSSVASQFAETNKAVALFLDAVKRNGVLDYLEKLMEKIIWFFMAPQPLRI